MNFNWHQINEVTEQGLAENTLTELLVAGKKIGLLKRQGKIHAFSATCPHAGANLCAGWIDGLGRIVCPEHKYRFDPVNGRNTSGEGYKLFTYPVEIKNNGIFIGILNAS